MLDTVICRIHGIRKGEPHYDIYKYLNRYKASLKSYQKKRKNISNRVLVERSDLENLDFSVDQKTPCDFQERLDELLLPNERLYRDKDNPNIIKTIDIAKLKKGLPFDEKTIDIYSGDISDTLITLKPDAFVWKNYTTGKEHLQSARGDVWLPTKHYHIAFSINENRSFIELNFSIPKFMYGTNVFQFCEHFDSRHFHATNSRTFERQCETLFPRFMRFMDVFFRKVFPSFNIDKMMVQVFRLDFCFNQVFDTAEDSYMYQKYLLGIQKKFNRDDPRIQVHSSGNNNLFISSSRCSYNIYHKGKEFEKSDLPELKKINKKWKKKYGKPLYTDLASLQELASRTVRYEMRQRNSYMSYLYKRHVFRKNCISHQKRKLYFDNLHNTKFKYESFVKKDWDKRRLKGIPPYSFKELKVTKNEREFYQRFGNMMSRVCDFNVSNKKNPFHLETPLSNKISMSLGISLGYDYMTTKDMKINKPKTTFSKDLMSECLIQFRKFIDNYQLSKKPNNYQISELIMNYNNEVEQFNLTHPNIKDKKKKVQQKKYITLFSLMDTGYTFDTACAKMMVHRNTKSGWKRELKKIGIDINGILPVTINKELNFNRYQDYFQKYYDTFFKVYVKR